MVHCQPPDWQLGRRATFCQRRFFLTDKIYRFARLWRFCWRARQTNFAERAIYDRVQSSFAVDASRYRDLTIVSTLARFEFWYRYWFYGFLFGRHFGCVAGRGTDIFAFDDGGASG